MQPKSVKQTFTAALDALVEQIKQDRSILAAVLCGSLSHDTVWAKSDIDLVLVTIDDRKIERSDLALNADGVNVHAMLMPRASSARSSKGRSTTRSCTRSSPRAGCCTRTIEHRGSLRQAAHDRRARHAARSCCARRRARCRPSTRRTNGSSRAATSTTPRSGSSMPRRRWRRIEVIGRRLLADREVLPQALTLNPGVLQDGLHRPAEREEDAEERGGGARRRRRLPRRTRAGAVRAGARLPARGGRRPLEQRDRRPLQAQLRRRRRRHGLRVPGRPGPDRQGVDAGAPDKRSNVDVQELAFFHHGRPMR